MRRFILAVIFVFMMSVPVWADYTYSYNYSDQDFFEYNIFWSFTVPSLLTETTEFQAAQLTTAVTDYILPIASVRISAPSSASPGVQTTFETDNTGFTMWLLTFGYGRPFDASGIYFNSGIENNGTLTITSAANVPEPLTMILLGMGLIGLASYRVRHP